MIKIYSIICPIENKPKYVGKTILSLRSRLSQHINQAKKNVTKKDKWIMSLEKNADCLKIVLLDEVKIEFGEQIERQWIQKFGLQNLVNGNSGGGGKNSTEVTRNCAYKHKFVSFLKSSGYSKSSINNNSSCVSKFINYFKHEEKSPREINIAMIANYLNTIKNKNSRNSAIVALKLFYKKIVSQPNKLKNIRYEYS